MPDPRAARRRPARLRPGASDRRTPRAAAVPPVARFRASSGGIPFSAVRVPAKRAPGERPVEEREAGSPALPDAATVGAPVSRTNQTAVLFGLLVLCGADNTPGEDAEAHRASSLSIFRHDSPRHDRPAAPSSRSSELNSSTHWTSESGIASTAFRARTAEAGYSATFGSTPVR